MAPQSKQQLEAKARRDRNLERSLEALVLACNEAVTVADRVRAAKELAALELLLERREREQLQHAATQSNEEQLPAAKYLRQQIEERLAKALAHQVLADTDSSAARPTSSRAPGEIPDYPVVRGLLQ